MTKYQREYQSEMDILADAIRSAPSNEDRKILMGYRSQTFPYFVPRYYPQSKINPERRKCNLISGFPYTSIEYPWPIDKDTNQHLQPIAQLDLDVVGELLNDNFGKGLLQVWGYDAITHGFLKADHRIIPKSATCNEVSTIFPSNIACAMQFSERVISRPSVVWKFASEMFMGTDEYVSVDPINDAINVQSDDWIDSVGINNDNLGSTNEVDFSDDNYCADVILSLGNTPYFGTYLGGYGGNYGSRGYFLKIDPAIGRLLIRIGCDNDDSNLGVIAMRNKDGSVTFDIETCYL